MVKTTTSANLKTISTMVSGGTSGATVSLFTMSSSKKVRDMGKAGGP